VRTISRYAEWQFARGGYFVHSLYTILHRALAHSKVGRSRGDTAPAVFARRQPFAVESSSYEGGRVEGKPSPEERERWASAPVCAGTQGNRLRKRIDAECLPGHEYGAFARRRARRRRIAAELGRSKMIGFEAARWRRRQKRSTEHQRE